MFCCAPLQFIFTVDPVDKSCIFSDKTITLLVLELFNEIDTQDFHEISHIFDTSFKITK